MRPSRKTPNSPVPELKNILFIRLRLLGDIILTIPSLRLFKEQYPSCVIYYVVEEKFAEIGRLLPFVDHLLVIPRQMGVRDLWRLGKQLKKLNLDAVVDFHSGPRSALLTRLAGAPLRIGYRTPNRNWAYNRLTPRALASGYLHSVRSQASLLMHLGINKENPPPYPPVSIDETSMPEFLRSAAGVPKKVVIHVGSGNRFRDWGIGNFSHLIDLLLNGNVSVYLVGHGEEEIKKAARLANKPGVHDLTGKLGIPEMFFLISRSQCYFGADSGPMHLASLTSTPIVCLFGPNLPEISGPWRQENTDILQFPLDCRPCPQRQCRWDDFRCIQSITPEVVHETIYRNIFSRKKWYEANP